MKLQNLDLKNIYEWPLAMQGVVFALIFVVVLYFGYLLDIADMRLQLAGAKSLEEDLRLQVATGVRKEAAISKEISRFPVLTNQLKQWQKKLVSRKELSELLNDILKIGANNHLYFDLLDLGDQEKAGLYIKVPIRAKVVGSYHEIAQFISQVANLPWIVVVGDFTIDINNKISAKGAAINPPTGNILSGDFIFEVYHVPEQAS